MTGRLHIKSLLEWQFDIVNLRTRRRVLRGPRKSDGPARRCFWLIVLLITLVGAGCGKRDGLQGTVVILLDTVRADHLSCYGYSRDTSPNMPW